MAWAKRIVLFLAVNILVVLSVSIILQVLGVGHAISAYGIDYQSLAVFCLVWGMTGSLISLALSRVMAKWMMGVQVIDPQTRDAGLQELVQMVHALSRSAGLPVMPEVGVYDSPEINAFATGPTRSRALVAVSSGLLHRMRHEEIEGVLGHEIAHVANGDMVTMTLVQGVINAFVMFLSRVLAFVITQALRSRDEEERGVAGSYWMRFAIQMVLEMVLMVLGSMVVAWFSRYREFKADAGGARLAGRESMIGALRALQRVYGMGEEESTSAQPQSMQAFKISGRTGGFLALFSTHPPLEERIARLESMSLRG